MSIEIAATFAGLLFGSIGTLLTVRNHVRTINRDWREKWETEMHRKAQAEVKEYAAQRDFQHLSKHQDQMKEAIKLLQDETDDQSKTLVEVQTTMKGLYHQVSSIAAKLDSSTGGWMRPPQRD